MKKLLLCASFVGALGWAASAEAAGGVKVGTLTCHERSGLGLILGSKHRVRCEYQGVNGSARYVGHITRIGVDVGYQGPTDMVWAVFAPSNNIGPHDLDGGYGGVTAGAAIGVGVGANALVGGSDRTIALQPLSIEGKTGLHAAAGIGGLSLTQVRGSYAAN
jgi:hypothetical protein